MVHFCCVIGCKKEWYPGCGLSFHRMPKNELRAEAWKTHIPGKVTRTSVICNLHFKDEDFINPMKKKLKLNAIPSVFPLKKTAQINPGTASMSESHLEDEVTLKKTAQITTDQHGNSTSGTVSISESHLEDKDDYIMIEPCILKVCRICFDSDCKLYPMTVNKKLDKAYKMITGLSVQIKNEVNLPPYLCAECAHRLINCIRFRARSLRANLLMLEIYKKDKCVTLEAIRSVAGKQIGSTLSITHYPTNHYDLKIETENMYKEDDQTELNKWSSLHTDNIIDDIKVEMDILDHNYGKSQNDTMVFLPENRYDSENKMDSPKYPEEYTMNDDIQDDIEIDEIKVETEDITQDSNMNYPSMHKDTVNKDLKDDEINQGFANENIFSDDMVPASHTYEIMTDDTKVYDRNMEQVVHFDDPLGTVNDRMVYGSSVNRRNK